MGESQEELNSRRRFYGEVKTWPQINTKISPEALLVLNKHRGRKSWSAFMEDLAQMLEAQGKKS